MLLNRFSNVNIVIHKHATICERFASSELKKYLEQIFSFSVTVSEKNDKNSNNFVISHLFDNTKDISLGSEGFYIGSCNNDILILGNNDNDGYNRGTLYGVYEFLEQILGCCFAAYSKDGVKAGEIIPAFSEFEIKEFEITKQNADLPYRTAIVQYDAWVGNADHALNIQFFDWLAKNRYNRILT